MKCTILHEGKGRMRVHVEKVRMTLHRADVLEAYLNHNDAIIHADIDTILFILDVRNQVSLFFGR